MKSLVIALIYELMKFTGRNTKILEIPQGITISLERITTVKTPGQSVVAMAQ